MLNKYFHKRLIVFEIMSDLIVNMLKKAGSKIFR